jgi:hypothetical protein
MGEPKVIVVGGLLRCRHGRDRMVVGTPFSTIFHLYHGGQFIGGGNQSTLRKPQVTDKLLSHNVVSSTPCHEQNSSASPTSYLWRGPQRWIPSP